MFKWLSKIFEPDSYLLVARITHTIKWRHPAMGIYEWRDVPITFRCYESKFGKRKFDYSCLNTIIDVDRMDIYSDLNGWKKRTHNLLNIPTYYAVADGSPILIREG